MVYMDTGCILNVIHVEATKMKREVIDGFYRGDILEGMMNGQNTLYFITLHDSADERSGGVGSQLDYLLVERKDRISMGRTPSEEVGT